MIEINYEDPTDVIRSNIGDPNTRFVSDSTIVSALNSCDNNIAKASILIMETMLTFFSVQADESRTDEVEYKFTKLYERYTLRLKEFKSVNSVKGIPIFIGGTSLQEKNRVANDSDTFSAHFLDDWRTLQEQQRLVEDRRINWDD